MIRSTVAVGAQDRARVNSIRRIKLTSIEARQIADLLDSIMGTERSVLASAFLRRAHVFAEELPRRVRQVMYDYKLSETAVGIRISGTPISSQGLELTPISLPKTRVNRFSREEVMHILFAELLGEVVGWSFTRHGNIVHDILPIPEHHEERMSSGSELLLDLHTDNAFHPVMNDYLGWLCMRNPNSVPMVVANVADLQLGENLRSVLFSPRFLVSPNAGHTGAKPPSLRVPILYGHPSSPYIRLNLNVHSPITDDYEAQVALGALAEALEGCTFDVPLRSGDLFFLDNFRAVHGRRPFQPRYDGTDRWLKRLCIDSRFRDSRYLRDFPQSRVIHPPRQADSDE